MKNQTTPFTPLSNIYLPYIKQITSGHISCIFTVVVTQI